MEIVIVAILILLVYFLIRTYLKTRKLKKIRQRVLNIPKFDSELFDCYVKLNGHIKSENAFSTPVSNYPCAFYRVKVLALWEAKQKKPGKGMAQQKKLIFDTFSPATLLVSTGKDNVSVEMSEFFKNAKALSQLHEKQTKSLTCPSICRIIAQPKYKKYQVQETWCCHAEHLVIYGKLIKNSEGLYMKSTELSTFPSFIGLLQHDKAPLKKLKKEITKKWLIFFLIVAVGVFFSVIVFMAID